MSSDNITLAMLVLDPPVDKMATLIDFMRPVASQTVITVDSRTKPETTDKLRALVGDENVVMFDWIDDFSAARNASLGLAKNPWTLVLDFDEMCSLDMLNHMIAVTQQDTAALGWLYWTRNYWDGVLGPEENYHWHARLFKTGVGKFYNRVHELVSLNGKPESSTRGTGTLPQAPKEAYLLHSKPHNQKAIDDSILYGRIGHDSR